MCTLAALINSSVLDFHQGAAGPVSVVIGSTNTGVGGAIVLSGGINTGSTTGTTGGGITIATGTGSAGSGPVILRTANAMSAGYAHADVRFHAFPSLYVRYANQCESS